MTRPSLQGEVGVVGAGILGLAVARELLRRHPGVRVTVLDKEPELGRHQTGRNSGVVHAGIYYPPGSLKARLCTRGVRLLRAYCDERGLAYDECGKVIVATSQRERPALEALLERGTANGVPDLRLLDRRGLAAVEPEAAGVAALHSPRTAITDFRAVAGAFADEVRERGGELRLGVEVTAVVEGRREVVVRSTAGDEGFNRLVTCAGLHSDEVAGLSGDGPDPRIIPFRGDYWRLRAHRRGLVRGLIYPVPDPQFPFLGIHLTRRVDGEVLVGPNAVLALAREGYRLLACRPRELAATLSWPGFRALARQHWRQGLREVAGSLSRRRFAAEAQRYVPALRPQDLVRSPAGVRAQAVDAAGRLVDDFRFSVHGRVVHVRNAPSPAATSSMAIAEHIADVVEEAAA